MTFTYPTALRALIGVLRRAVLFPLGERVEWYANMVVITQAGISKQDAITEIHSSNAKLGRRVKTVYEAMLRGLASGTNLGVVVEPFVPPSERAVLAAGDRAGTNEGFRSAAAITLGLKRMRNALVMSLAYPVMLLVVFVTLMGNYAKTALPMYDKHADAIVLDWDLGTYLVILRVASGYPLVVAGVVVACLVALFASFPLYRGRFRRQMDRWFPPHIIYRYYVSAVSLLSLAAMLRAGLPIEDALKHLVQHANAYLRSHMGAVLSAVMRGEAAIAAWDTGLFPPTYMIRISALARAGSVGEAIVTLGDSSLDYAVGALVKSAVIASLVIVVAIGILVAYSLIFMNTVGLAAANSY